MADGRGGLGPLSVAFLPPTLALFVWPARALLTLDRPFAEAPRWQLIGLITAFGLFALGAL